MNRKHATVIAILLGLAAAFGLFAATRTAHLGSAARHASSVRLAAQQRRIATAEHLLRRQLAQHPHAAPATAAAPAPKTVYVRPAPIIVHLHRHGEESESD